MHKVRKSVCKECGCSSSGCKSTAAFCSRKCRNAHNNRRMQRGAEFYDMFMVMRYERGLAKKLNLWTMMCRMAKKFKAQDDHERRKSWNDPGKIIKARADLHAITLVGRVKR